MRWPIGSEPKRFAVVEADAHRDLTRAFLLRWDQGLLEPRFAATGDDDLDDGVGGVEHDVDVLLMLEAGNQRGPRGTARPKSRRMCEALTARWFQSPTPNGLVR